MCHDVTLLTILLLLVTVDTLKQIAVKLKMNWNFSVDPCSGEGGWVETFDAATANYLANNLTCGDCNQTTNICHVTSM